MNRDIVLGGKYRLVRLLGQGGMGAVYEAENTWTHRRVAIKVLHSEYADNDQFAKRFMQEAQVASRFQHPNVIDVLDMGRDTDGTLFIVQEFLEGSDLDMIVESNRTFTLAETMSLLCPVLSALSAVHNAGIVHRDVKFDNVFLTRTSSGRLVPKLIDFGISRVSHASEESARMTRVGLLMGTPSFMSPEQARGELDLDGRTDIWAMGVMFYTLLTGVRLFSDDNYNLAIIRIATVGAPKLRAHLPSVPEDLERVVDRALAHKREDRWATADLMLNELLACASVRSAGVTDEVREGPLPIDIAAALLPVSLETSRGSSERQSMAQRASLAARSRTVRASSTSLTAPKELRSKKAVTLADVDAGEDTESEGPSPIKPEPSISGRLPAVTLSRQTSPSLAAPSRFGVRSVLLVAGILSLCVSVFVWRNTRPRMASASPPSDIAGPVVDPHRPVASSGASSHVALSPVGPNAPENRALPANVGTHAEATVDAGTPVQARVTATGSPHIVRAINTRPTARPHGAGSESPVQSAPNHTNTGTRRRNRDLMTSFDKP